MYISYGRAAYVSGLTSEQMDLIIALMNTTAVGDNTVIVDREGIVSFIAAVDNPDTAKEYSSSDRVLADLLNTLETSIEGKYGDVFFSR